MPIMDAQLIFCEGKSIAAAAGNHTHGDNIVRIPAVYDHTETAMDDRPNQSGRLYWNCVVEDEDMLAAVDGSVVTFYLYNGDTGTNPLVDNAGVAIDSVAITENTPSEHKDGTSCSPVLCQGDRDMNISIFTSRLPHRTFPPARSLHGSGRRSTATCKTRKGEGVSPPPERNDSKCQNS